MPTVRVADVALDPRTGGADAIYTYAAENDLEVGQAVFVTVGNRTALGFVVAVYDTDARDLGFPLDKLRPIQNRIEGLSIPGPLVDLARFVAAEYLCSLPLALSPAIPPGVRDRLQSVWVLNEPQPSSPVTPTQQEVLRTLADVGGTLVEQKTKPIAPGSLRALKLLRAKGYVRHIQRLAPTAERRKQDVPLRLTGETARIEAFLKHEGRKRPAQALTLIRLQGAEAAQFSAAEIRALAAVTDATVKALVTAGLLEPVGDEPVSLSKPPPLNPYQELAVGAIAESIVAAEFRGFLLFGVTGSGKTEVYLRAAAEALRHGRQVLYLVPEIALAAQVIASLRARFGSGVAILHSDLPQVERLNTWLRIRSGEVSVVLGARSSIFAPLERLGLVIVDEEHETSYKQDNAPRYHARDLALFLGKRHGCPVVLGSATPSIETFFDAEQSESGNHGLTLLSLPERVASASLPEVEIEDLTFGFRHGRPALITPELEQRVRETVARGEQVILFLNRRAYAPFILCRDCGQRVECPNCAVSLSYHRREHRVRCHHCGYAVRPPESCPKCKGPRVHTFGAGTEKVEEAVIEMFPEARVARLDRDVARKKGALEQILADFRSGHIGILVGTQMVAKGLDFPNVTLVGVVAADVSLNIPDFRSSERTYQLLSQVAGRAGRGDAPGTVVIQTFNPEHPAIVAAARHDYVSFYEELKRERREATYPPFRRLVNVVLSGESLAEVIKAADDVKELLEAVPRAQVLGPVDCALERVQGRWRRHLLVKLPRGASAKAIGEAVEGVEVRGVQIVLDVDPQNLM